MDHLVIENFRPYEGRYGMDLSQGITTREWGWLKRLAGYSPLTVEDGYRTYDPEFWAVFAVILLRRAGKIQTRDVEATFERLVDEDFTSVIRIEFDAGDVAEVDDENADPTGSSTGSIASSGPASSESSETPTTPTSRTPSSDPPSPSGTPASASSVSGPTTSET